MLYVPVTQLDLVSKYIGAATDGGLKLNRLGGTEWQKTRKRVKAAVRDMAKQLTALYAKRMSVKGYAFSPDTDLQNDFERRFEYDETDDQLRCINEIKRDMEREFAPLRQAEDAVLLDTSKLDIDGVIGEMKRIVGEKIGL